ncbi:hypothetical protein FYK55_06405 [Roseiconus nitratireducens]|uniref:Uncharacterized protein n=1 Tax=Roseiconus nitratireducens TaxID=2605748 RepID=A0A5M6DCN6_9BACT|nr:hypothetical protein [Roseiconus nitratireducens]KAA5545284.1 hypothetical protein FYK55_06405 [Roseiconus nitratireducens]
MKQKRTHLAWLTPVAMIAAVVLFGDSATADASSPTGWSPVVVPTGPYRERIKSMPIEHRPGRPLHVYGNTIRLFDQRSAGYEVAPLRQILFGRTTLRGEPFLIR